MLKQGLVVLVLIIGLSGCLKWYCCGNNIYYYKCANGTGTVYVAITGAPDMVQNNITDSVNKYRLQGYVCGYSDTSGAYWECVQGDAHKKNAEAGGLPCINSDNNLCSAAADPQCTN